MPDPDDDLQDVYFEALAQRVAEGRIPSTREPLPLRSLARLLAEIASDTARDAASEARGSALIIAVLVARLGGDVTIDHADLAAAMPLGLDRHDDGTRIRLITR